MRPFGTRRDEQVIDTQDNFLEGLAAGGQGDTIFWFLLLSVGAIALLVGLKVMFQERRRNPNRDRE
jgi:hypothetical protein